MLLTLLGVLVLGAARAGKWLGQRAKTPPQEKLALVVPAEALDVGEVWDDDILAVKLPIENRGDEPVTISGFSRSCDCERVEPEQLTIPVAGKRVVTVRIDLAAKIGDNLDGPTQFATMISPRMEDRSGDSWVIKGRLRKGVQLSRGMVDFREIIDTGEAKLPSPEVIEVAVKSPHIDHLKVANENKRFLIQTTRQATTYKVTVRLREIGHAGLNRDTIKITPVDRVGKALRVRRIPVFCTVVGDVYTVPSALSFGSRNRGRMGKESISVFSRSDRPVTILRVKTSGPATVASLKSKGDQQVLSVEQRFPHAGFQEAFVDILAQAGTKKSQVRVPISYFGK